MRTDDLKDTVIQQSGKKVFLQKISVTSTGTATALAATDVEGNAVGAGATLMLQCNQDFYYQLIGSTASTSITLPASTRPGTKVLADQQEFVVTAALDGKLDLIRVSADGTLCVFVVK